MPIHVRRCCPGGLQPPGSTARRRRWPPRPTIRPRSGSSRTGRARREGLRRQLRRLPPAQRQGRRPDQAAGRLAGGARCRQASSRSRWCNGQNNGDAVVEAALDTEIAAVVTYTKNNWSNKTGQLVQPADVSPPASNPPHSKAKRHERSSSTSGTATPRARSRPRPPRAPHGWRRWLTRPTTGTSARCTCCSRSRC